MDLGREITKKSPKNGPNNSPNKATLLFTLNCNSIRSKWLELESLIQDLDICTFTETKLDETVPDTAIMLKDHCINR